jgi:hypothetical protein
MVVTPVIPATLRVAIRRITVQSQPKQRVCQTPSQPIGGSDAVRLSSQLHRDRRITVQIDPGINTKPYLKN